MSRRRPRNWLAALLGSAALAAGCSPAPPDPGAAPAEAPASAASLVLLISLDTLRADHLGSYGYERPTSPRLDALARRGVRFLDASSTSTWTLPAHASLLTGRYVDGHGVRTQRQALGPRVPTLAGLLSRAGWTTGAAVNSLFLSRRFGLQRGFDLELYVEESAERVSPSTWITDQALAWVDEHGDGPLFLFLHYYDIHSDYAALPRHRRLFEEPYEGEWSGSTVQLLEVQEGEATLGPADARHLVDLYDAGIRQTDAELGRLFDALAERGRWDDTLVVVTSDHGEEFLEHGGVLHGRSQFQEQLRVPLLWAGPGLPAGVGIDVPVSLVDVAPTLLDLLGLDPPADMQGVSLRPLWTGEEGGPGRDRVLFSESSHGPRRRPVVTWAARAGPLKQVVDAEGRSALYDLEDDPEERRPLPAEAHPEGGPLQQAFRAFRTRVEGAPAPTDTRLAPDERAHLRALGYLAAPDDAEDANGATDAAD